GSWCGSGAASTGRPRAPPGTGRPRPRRGRRGRGSRPPARTRSGRRATARPSARPPPRPAGGLRGRPGPTPRRARPGPARRPRRSAASLLQLVAENGQTGGLETEAQAAVELEGRVVVELGVHDRPRDAVAPHPMERVEGKGAAEATALVGGIDRETLEVAVSLRPTAHRVRAESGVAAGDAEPGRGGGVDGVLQAGAVEPPERVERDRVDGEGGAAVGLPAPAQSRPAGAVRE